MDTDTRQCSRCGMDKAEWSEEAGYQKEGELYCCSGCAENTGCVCESTFDRPDQPGGYAGL